MESAKQLPKSSPLPSWTEAGTSLEYMKSVVAKIGQIEYKRNQPSRITNDGWAIRVASTYVKVTEFLV